MKITKHEKTGKPEKLDLTAKPLTVFLSRQLELRIDKGDTIKEVGRVIEEEWGLKEKSARQLAAFWFAIGERQARKKLEASWSKKELDASPSRRYLAK